ncbi:class-III pyridoxal-phosphate-dependent aminotransferase [Peredibacter starrii]|uniref:Aspartate aminotransferase family protein n=1 Tax=Peredibacter starrii TaxID=28202 RepID=A0AAX4HU78_9BACT|nr:aspartate aminotransferase family protein [Peredibacter starrii]WPU66510.1 aspartate aminotransferase family protein [Peredibacter starrii]
MQINSREEKHFAKSEEAKPLRIKDAEGSYLISEEGKRYIDFSSGWCVGNLGWKHPQIDEAIRNFKGPTYIYPHFEYEPWFELASLLSEITPGKLTKCFRATGGTEAVEIALQAAMAHTGRQEFIAIDGAYHGNSIATQGLVGDSPFFNWKKLKPPLTEESLNDLEKLLKGKKVAAFIMEPVSMNLDVMIPKAAFMQGMQELCRKYGTLIIMDEVATGFGRTGKLFATEYFDIEPDIMCIAKALSAGAAPIGATLLNKEVGKSMQEENYPYSTYGWHPLSVAAAIASVRFFQKHWDELQVNIQFMNEYFQQRFSQMEFKKTPKMNIMGMAMHLDFGKSDYGEKVTERAFKKGLILAEGTTLFPALDIDFETAKAGLDILEKSL